MELAKFFGVIRRWIVLIILGTAMTAVAAYGVVSRTPPTYRATASIWVTSGGLPGVYTSATDLENFSQTYAQLIPSTPVVRRALDSIGDGTSADAVLTEVAARAIPRTAIIEIAVTDRNPERAQLLANAVANTFVATTTSGATKLSIASPAALPTVSADRRMGLIGVLLATVVGFAMVTALSFVLDYVDDRVRSAAELEDTLGLRFLGAVPRWSGSVARGSGRWASDPGSRVADAYRRLRPSLLRVLRDKPTSVLVVSPSVAVERGPIVLNLAAALGETGARVVVVDADPHQPWLTPTLGLPERIGLVDLIERTDVSVNDTLRKLNIPGVWLLPVGKVAGSSSATLSSDRVGQVMKDIQASADIALFACAPIESRSDASALAPYVRHVVLIVDAERERRELILRGEAELERAGANVAGAIMVNVAAGDLQSSVRDRQSLTVAFEPLHGGMPTNGQNLHRVIGAEQRRTESDIAIVNHQS